MDELDLPPLLSACRLPGGKDPVPAACAAAARGCDAGQLFYTADPGRLRAAIVLAPETSLEAAMAALPACAVGLQNAIGALCPPELAVHLGWTGAVMVNGAECGRFSAVASTCGPDVVPDWLVVGVELFLLPPDEQDPGATPDRTVLFLEGGGDVQPRELLESWARHALVWLTRLDDGEGRATLHRHWTALGWRLQEEVTVPHDGKWATGTFLGLDENFGMLLRDAAGTIRLIPLSSILQRT